MKTEEEQKGMSDTPETDAACWCEGFGANSECVLAKFARELERERDAARMALRELWQSVDAFLPHFDSETIARWRKAAGWEGEK